MKRLLLCAAAALCGSFSFISPASAHVDGPYRSTVVRPASDPPPKVTRVVRVQAPLPKVTVALGDNLTAIGARTHRTWQQLASYNHLPNPNLILVGQVLTVPPASFVAGPVTLPSIQAPPPTRTYTPARSVPVVTSTPVVQSGPTGGFQACVAWRESTNGAGSSNIYGILPSTWASLGLGGNPYTASRAQQDAAFQTLYARDGSRPWSPYDGC